MKQMVFMVAVTLFGMVGSFRWGPFVGLAVYVFYDMLRPQFVWKWVMPANIPWSLYVALAALVATPLVGPSANPHLGRGGRLTLVRLFAAHVPFFAFISWITLTYFTAIRPAAGDFVMEGYVKTALMYAVGVVAVSSVRQVWLLVMVFVVALGYIAYEINFMYLTQGYMGIARDGHGGLDNNGAGMLLAMGVPLCAFAWEAYRGWYRWLFAGLIPVLLHAVLLTYSRGAMLSLILSSPFWLFRGGERWAWAGPGRDRPAGGWVVVRRDRWLKYGIGFLIACAIPVMAGKQIQDRFFSTAKFDQDGSAQSRFTSWGIGWRMALERPLFGFGVRNSSLFTKQYGADIEGRVIHSQYLQVAADNGLVGLGLYLWLVGSGAWGYQRVIRAARRHPDPDSQRAVCAAMGAQAALVTFLCGAVFLSCEMFEPQYWLLLMGLHLPLVYRPPAPDPVVRPPAAVPVPTRRGVHTDSRRLQGVRR